MITEDACWLEIATVGWVGLQGSGRGWAGFQQAVEKRWTPGAARRRREKAEPRLPASVGLWAPREEGRT